MQVILTSVCLYIQVFLTFNIKVADVIQHSEFVYAYVHDMVTTNLYLKQTNIYQHKLQPADNGNHIPGTTVYAT